MAAPAARDAENVQQDHPWELEQLETHRALEIGHPSLGPASRPHRWRRATAAAVAASCLCVAAGLTLITNPFTLAFWLWLAYKVGGTLLGTSGPVPDLEPVASRPTDIMDWISSFGAPAVLGMGLFAVFGAALAYIIVKLAWRVRIWFKRWHR